MARSAALQQMLGEVLEAVEPPTGGQDFRASYARNRHIQQLLAAKALDALEERLPGAGALAARSDRTEAWWVGFVKLAEGAAEAKWPGFIELVQELVARELEFMDKAGPVA